MFWGVYNLQPWEGSRTGVLTSRTQILECLFWAKGHFLFEFLLQFFCSSQGVIRQVISLIKFGTAWNIGWTILGHAVDWKFNYYLRLKAISWEPVGSGSIPPLLCWKVIIHLCRLFHDTKFDPFSTHTYWLYKSYSVHSTCCIMEYLCVQMLHSLFRGTHWSLNWKMCKNWRV